MYKKSLASLVFLSSVLCANELDVKSGEWNLVGATQDINLSSLGLNNGDTLWHYKNGDWYCHIEGYESSFNKLTSLNSGEAFWIKSIDDINISMGTGAETALESGWNMMTPTVSDINISEYAQENDVQFAFAYQDGVWSAYSQNGITQTVGFDSLETIKPADGVWVYKTNMSVGNDKTLLKDGVFQNVIKSSTDDVEDIWNVSFRVDITTDYEEFEIGVKFFKREDDGSDDIGEFVYRNLTINSSELSNPDALFIEGTGDSGSGGTYFYSGYNPNNMLENSIELNSDVLTLKLGLLMKNQDMVDETTFKVKEDYDIYITSNVPIIKDSKNMDIDIINPSKYDFSNSNGIEGRIEIK
jgi:hypothetical protein